MGTIMDIYLANSLTLPPLSYPVWCVSLDQMANICDCGGKQDYCDVMVPNLQSNRLLDFS